MRGYNRDCGVCRLMRSLAFSGLGMLMGYFAAHAYGASQQNSLLTGIVVSAIIVFGIVDKKNKE